MGSLEMKSSAERWLRPGDRAAIEQAIPAGYRMTVGYQHSPGEWNVRVYDSDGVLCLMLRNQVRPIKAAAFIALARLAAAGVSAMTVTVDLEGAPTLVGWEPKP